MATRCEWCDCKMHRIFPPRQETLAIDAILARFVECRYCDNQKDTQSGKHYAVRYVEGVLYVNGTPYQSVAEWLRCLGLVDV